MTRLPIPAPRPLAPSSTFLSLALALLTAAGCSTPNKPNIELRRQNAQLQSQVDQLTRQREADAATIRALESRGVTTVSSLPNDRVAQLFTAHGLQFGRLTGGADLDPAKPGEEGVKVYVVPVDGANQPIKCAGSFVVEAFDLAAGGDNPRLARWEFPLEEAAKNWYGQALLYTYVLSCPWPASPPRSAEVTLRIAFTDALTSRVFTEQKVVKIATPPAAPTTTAGTR